MIGFKSFSVEIIYYSRIFTSLPPAMKHFVILFRRRRLGGYPLFVSIIYSSGWQIIYDRLDYSCVNQKVRRARSLPKVWLMMNICL